MRCFFLALSLLWLNMPAAYAHCSKPHPVPNKPVKSTNSIILPQSHQGQDPA